MTRQSFYKLPLKVESISVRTQRRHPIAPAPQFLRHQNWQQQSDILLEVHIMLFQRFLVSNKQIFSTKNAAHSGLRWKLLNDNSILD